MTSPCCRACFLISLPLAYVPLVLFRSSRNESLRMLMIREWCPLTAALSMRMSFAGSPPMVWRSLFMLYSAITWPSRLKTNLAMCVRLYRVSAEPTQDLVENLRARRKCIQDMRHDHGHVVAP